MTDHDLLLDLKRRVEALEALSQTTEAFLPGIQGVNFSVNSNAFVSKYAHGKTGKEKFTWLVAFLSKGHETTEVALKDVESLWSRMTAKTLLGTKFNRAYTNEAKTRGWVDSPRPGYYRLAAGWYEVNEEKSER